MNAGYEYGGHHGPDNIAPMNLPGPVSANSEDLSDPRPEIHVGDRFWIEVEVKGVNSHYEWATVAHRSEDGWTSTANWFTAPFTWLTRRNGPEQEAES